MRTAVQKKQTTGVGGGAERSEKDVDEGETLLGHLVNYTEG